MIGQELLRFLLGIVERSSRLAGLASDFAISRTMRSTRNRPHPWSTVHDYISWQGLTDRRYLARHLPPLPVAISDPSADRIRELFRRPAGGQQISDKSTCLFPAFAQYLTDGFIRTDTSHDADPLKRRLTTSNHEIDLCPLYGRTLAQTDCLRLKSEARGKRGRLKSETGRNGEFAPFLFGPDGAAKPEFAALDKPLGLPDTDPDRLAAVFAFGGDRANATPFVAMMNTLLLREHNRLAGELEKQNSGWDDERVFQTARNILIPMFIKIVVEDYINHIAPLPIRLMARASVAWRAAWNRTNWITVEFSLLYRWHSLMPDAIDWPDGAPIPIGRFPMDNRPLLAAGLSKAFAAASGQKAGEVGARNTADALLMLEDLAVDQARTLRLPRYNDYREQFGMARAKHFSDISSDAKIQALLADLYREPDDVEFYPGLFAEDRVKNSPLPGLLTRMVAVDAFSQALTNPLLSQHIPPEEAFTRWGVGELEKTQRLDDVLRRNCPSEQPPKEPITMTQSDWRYTW